MTSEVPTVSKYRRLTEAEWVEAKTLFELGKKTKTDLSAMFSITRQSMHEGLLARGAVYGSKSGEVEKATIEAFKDNQTKKVEEIEAFKNKQKKMVEMVQNLSIRAVTDKLKDKKPVSDAKPDIDTLRAVMATLRMGRDELYHLYDLHRDPDAGEETEELIVSEYTPDEIEALNNERFGKTSDAALDVLSKEMERETDSNLDDLLGDDDA